RIVGHLLHHFVVEQADHHRIDITGENARRIGNGFLTRELHFRARQHQRGAAQLAHTDIEGDARAGGLLVEDHRQHAALQGLVFVRRAFGKTFALFLAGARIGNQMLQRNGIEFGEIEEVLRLPHPPSGGVHAATDAFPASNSRAAASSFSIASRTWVSSMLSGGRRRTTLSPAPRTSTPCLRAAVTKSVFGTRILRPSISPCPRTSSNTWGCSQIRRVSCCCR